MNADTSLGMLISVSSQSSACHDEPLKQSEWRCLRPPPDTHIRGHASLLPSKSNDKALGQALEKGLAELKGGRAGATALAVVIYLGKEANFRIHLGDCGAIIPSRGKVGKRPLVRIGLTAFKEHMLEDMSSAASGAW
eukprot:scaffold125689_cov34-Prasinocladus_malaysianus.AAC.1